MIDIRSIADLELLRESVDLECKLAAGRDGKGALPGDFWPTYSSFANTEGGMVLLGVKEKQGQFSIEGIANIAKVRKELFAGVNNRQKVSVNLLTDASDREVALQGRTILAVEIPRGNRKQRPVHLTTNPFGQHTFRRLNDGDRPLPDEEVKRMLAEQVEDSRDDRVLRGFDVNDLDQASFRAYRQVFANRDPNHPWNVLPDPEFLRQIGGWRKDRETGEGGITVAGLLMFGQMVSVQEEFPNYMLDYQERAEPDAELRWVDRLTLDGKWSGNLYDFYRKVYLKLTADLKVPFSLEKGERKDETPVHEALREALANVLVHADYSDRASVLVVKRPEMFGFRNPGLMRIPAAIAIQGGEHDCRNRTLHKMFRLVGVGEQAGSGIPKIYRGWASQHWRTPALYERIEPYNQTLLELRMVDLLPATVVSALRKAFGVAFDALGQNERLTPAAAASERVVTHARVREMTALHPFDLTRMLQNLVRDGFLEAHNPGRGAVYCLPGAALPKPEEVFGDGSEQSILRSAHLTDSSAHLAGDAAAEEHRDAEGRLLTDQLDAPVIDSLEKLVPAFREGLEELAIEPRTKGKLPVKIMKDVVLTICSGHYVTLSCLAQLVNRDSDAFRQQYLKPLAKVTSQ
ncbi:MAG: RNA-binding domain-containing protein [Rhizobiaceae bacterium]